MQNSISPQTTRRVMLTLGGIVVLILAFFLAERIPRTITIFVIGAFIAFGVQPVIVQLESRGMKRPVAIALVYLFLLLVLVLGALLILPATIEQGQVLVQNAPDYLKTTQSWITGAEESLRLRFSHANLPPQILNVHQLASDRIFSFLTSSFSSVGTFLIDAATALFIAISSLILSCFFLLQHKQIGEAFAQMFPHSKRATARELGAEITHIFGSFIAGQAIVSAITGISVTLLCLVVGFKYALILGLLSAVAYAIPIVGMLAAHLVGAIIAAPQGPWMILWVQIILFVVARISDNVLVPKIMGDSVGVSPIGVMFAVFAGGELFGLPGLILGIPAAALIKVCWRYFVAPVLYGAPLEPVEPLPKPRRKTMRAE
ncbi:MAG: AI-2E family transporter [Candidatus Baltobacteraceae bacterium]